MERRRFRRAELDVPVMIRSVEEGGSGAEVTGQVKDVSLAGVYCHIKAPSPLKPGEQVTCSVAIPPEQVRWFPFTRLTGRAWIVRIQSIQGGRREGEAPSGEQLLGVAIAFTPDVTALGSIEFYST